MSSPTLRTIPSSNFRREFHHPLQVPPSPPNTRPPLEVERRAEGGQHTPSRESVRDSSARHCDLYSWVRGASIARTR
jgi:hypothetical protein